MAAPATPRTAPVGRCPVCGATAADVLFTSPDRQHATPGTYTYCRCRSCRTVFQDPRVVPHDLGLCYPADYMPYAEEDPPAPAPRRLAGPRDALRRALQSHVRGEPLAGPWRVLAPLLAASRRLRELAFFSLLDELLPRAGHGRKGLDVGCGAGKLMATLGAVGWEMDGVEWNAEAAEVAAHATRGRVWAGDFREVDLPRGAYDLVLFNHVFEHLADPRGALGRAAELLRRDGRAVIVYPNPESFGARTFGPDWFPWEAPRHLVLPTRGALGRLAADLGWGSFHARTDARAAAYYLKNSRAYRARRPLEPEPQRPDRLLGHWERLLVALGLPRGEELVCVLAREGAAR
jgi:SAM-dependent methyltransferase